MAMTANALREDRDACLAAGMDDYVAKPIRPDELAAALRRARPLYEELRSRGVEFETDVLEFPWGYVAQLLDPDGNRLQIREGR